MKEEFKRIGRLLFQEGLVYSHGGSLSVSEGDKLWLTRAGAMLGELGDDDIIEVASGDNTAHKDLPALREIYKLGKAKALVHAHPASAIAISITDNKVVPQDAEGLTVFKAAPIVRARNEEISRMLPNFLNGENVIAVVKGEGSWAIGQSLMDAYKYTSCLENSCKVLVAVRSSGQARPAPIMNKDQQQRPHQRSPQRGGSAIPPGIGVMDRGRTSRYR